MKKILFAVLIASLCLVAFSTAFAADEKEIEVFTRFADGASKQYFDDVAASYMAEHPDVKITVSSADNQDYKKEINVRLSSNQMPDIYFSWSGVYARNFVEGGKALDLTDYIAADPDWAANVITSEFGPFTFDGKTYAIPFVMDGKAFYYNKDIFEELGLSVPEDWESFMSVLEVLKGTDYIPISLGNIDDWATGHYMTTLNQRMVDPEVLAADYNLEGDFSDENYVKALEHLNELVPYFTPDFNATSYETGISDFITGKAAIYYEQFNQVQYIEPAEFNWYWFDMPDIADGKGDQTALTGSPQGFLVSSATKYPEVCVDFLKYMTSVEMASKMVKDTMMISCVIGAINEDNADENFINISKTIQAATSINLWLDDAMDSELAGTYMAGIQAMVGGAMTPEQVMASVQEKAEELKEDL